MSLFAHIAGQGRAAISVSVLARTALFRAVSTSPRQLAGSDSSSESESESDSSESETEESQYSQSDSESELESESDQRSAILTAALNHVPQCGWSQAALVEGAKSLGLPPTSHGLFPRGAGELIDHFEQEANQQLKDFMKEEVERVPKSQFFHSALEYRLRAIIPYMDRWPQAMALKAFPPNVPTALENLSLMVDDVWYIAGDRSTDFNWYTKRALLALTYSGTELYMVQDNSVDYQDTWDFLDRRLEDAIAFSKARRQVEDGFWGASEILSAGLTTVRNMMGMNSRNR